MNYLMNLYLSKNLGERSLGFIIGEVVRNKKLPSYTPEIIEGIELNKNLVEFIKRHPAYNRGKSRLQPKYNKQAYKIITIFYDHFLAANWNKYSFEQLHSFTSNSYNYINHNFHIFPFKSRKLYSLFISNNVLENYDSIEGIHSYMRLLTHKDTFQSNLEYSLEILIKHYAEFKSEFEEIFPQLVEYVEKESLVAINR
jgi:acyl carrier protein phosphodiesterase